MSVGFRVGLCGVLVLLPSLCIGAANKTEGDKKGVNMFINFANLDIVDYLRSGFMAAVFLATILSDNGGRGRSGQKWRWPALDGVATLIFGLAFYFFPEQLLQYIVSGSNIACCGMPTNLNDAYH